MAHLHAGSTIGSSYVIDAEIGAGGMGVVYRARDLRLGRTVAVKVLSASALTNAEGVLRFEQEARSASSLNHPNIVTIHEIGRTDDVHFIVQEFIDGETLRQRLTRGRLPVGAALDVVIQMAGALAAAHAAGIVHRDIKPENVMLRGDGYVKVLDFGIATLPRPSQPDAETTAAYATRLGAVMGTPRYMSPEQARGLAVDARADVFGVGIVLFEAVAGRVPFDGATPADVIVSILQKEAPSLATIASDVPLELERIVGKALRKNPDERYQSVRELLVDVKALQASLTAPAPAAPVRRARRATLALTGLGVVALATSWFLYSSRTPALTEKDTILLTEFSNTTSDAALSGDTLRQALAVQLQQTPFLNLFPDGAVHTALTMMTRPPDEPVTKAVGLEICQRQGLKAMVSGSVASLGRRYVVTLEAIGAQSGRTLAIEQAEAEDLEHVLQAVGTAAMGLRKKLGESLTTLDKYNASVEQATSSSLEALKAYSEGMKWIYLENGSQALPFFTRALDLDPNFVAAYDWGSWANQIIGNTARASVLAAEGFRRRDRATEFEKLSVTSTYHHFTTGNFVEEAKTYAVWSRLFPNDWSPHSGLALIYVGTGRFEEAAQESREVVRLSPNIAQGYRFLSTALARLGRADEALAIMAQARAQHLDNYFNRTLEFGIAQARGDAAASAAVIEAVRRLDGDRPATLFQARAALTSGRWREAQALFEKTLPAGRSQRLPLEGLVAEANLGSCQSDEVTRSLEALGPNRAYALPVFSSDGALCSDIGEAERTIADLGRRHPEGTLANENLIPVSRSVIALRKNQPALVPDLLHSRDFRTSLLPFYLRGQAYLRLRQPAEAITEFRAIIEHPFWVPVSVFNPLSRLGLARAYAMANDRVAARRAYDDFFAAWKDADADLPPLIEAKREYARLDR